MSEIKDITDTEFNDLLEQVDLGELNIVKLQWDMLEELLGVVSASADSTLSTLGMALRDGKCGELLDGLVPSALFSFPLIGVVIALIDCTHCSLS